MCDFTHFSVSDFGVVGVFGVDGVVGGAGGAGGAGGGASTVKNSRRHSDK